MTATSERDDSLQVLTRVPNELEAALIVNTLTEYGIPATATGGFTSGFKAEAPGDVRVLVKRSDIAAARDLLRAATEDVEDATPPLGDESPNSVAEEPSPELARAWRAAMIGLVLFPPLLHLYSLWILLGRGFLFSASGPIAWRARAALLLDVVAILAFGGLYLTLLAF